MTDVAQSVGVSLATEAEEHECRRAALRVLESRDTETRVAFRKHFEDALEDGGKRHYGNPSYPAQALHGAIRSEGVCAATFQGSSSSMRLIGCSAMHWGTTSVLVYLIFDGGIALVSSRIVVPVS
jgi:hypothetical protein